MYTTSQKYLKTIKFFLILKVLFFMKQVEHHNGFIYNTKYEPSWATINTTLTKKPQKQKNKTKKTS